MTQFTFTDADILAEIAGTLGIPVDELPGLLNPVQAAQVLNTTSAVLASWRCTGLHQIPHYKAGQQGKNGSITYPLFGLVAGKRQNLRGCGVA